MPAWLVPLAISGISALSGALSNRKKTATQESTTTQRGSSFTDLYDLPMLSNEAATGFGTGLNSLINRVGRGVDISGLRSSGIRDINRSGDLQSRALERMLAARGLSNSPAAAAIGARQEDERTGKLFDFIQSLPLLQRQLESEDAMNLVRAASSMPIGTHRTGTTTTEGTSTSTGTATQPGDVLGGLFSGLGQGIASTWGYNYALDELMRKYGLANPGTSKTNGAKPGDPS